jgi:uncharacterized protein YlxW (UPF0749 family)
MLVRFNLMRRPARPRVNVKRSTGVAEHHFRTVLSRVNVNRIIAVASISALCLVPAVSAHAATTSDQIASTTKAIDAAAQRWFSAQADAARIDASIADIEHRINDAQARMEYTRKIATARAVVLYKNADVALTSMFGDSALDSARRAHLVDDANAGGDAAIAHLTAAVDDLNAQRRDLEAQRAQQQKTLREVVSERHTLDAELASVRRVAAHEATVALASAQSAQARVRATARVQARASVTTPTDATAAPTAPPITQTVFVPPPLTPSDNGRVSPHHDDPFLVCTRARESGGEYNIDTGNGYYGAYQFLPSTWDTTVVHEGRSDLVGVLPSRASEFDQDDTAWTLYQWQGKGPWGGRC